MIAYGRDTQETLYLCPGELVSDEDYEQMIRRRIGKEQPEAAYVTSVIRRRSVPAAQIGEMMRELYRKLDSSIILGKIRHCSWRKPHRRFKLEDRERITNIWKSWNIWLANRSTTGFRRK